MDQLKGWSRALQKHFESYMPQDAHVVYRNIPFMVMWADDKEQTTGVITADAVSVLPVRLKEGVLQVGLIRQERPEEGDVVIKAPGMYCLDYEKQTLLHPKEAAVVVCKQKAGIDVPMSHVRFIGMAASYPTVTTPVRIGIAIVTDGSDSDQLRWSDITDALNFYRLLRAEGLPTVQGSAETDDILKHFMYRYIEEGNTWDFNLWHW